MILANKDTTIYLGQQKLAEWAGIIVEASVKKSRIYQQKGETLRYFLKAIQYEFFLEDDEINAILLCIEKIAEITEWPTVPLLAEKEQPAILVGLPGGTGDKGTPGVDGDDANINTVSGDSIIKIVTTFPGGIKTNTITYNPYIVLDLTLAINSAGFPNAGSLIQELGKTVTSVPLTINIGKQANDIVSSVFTGPGTLTADYAALLNLTSINAGTPQAIVLTGGAITATQAYSVTADDSTNTPVVAKTVTFVVPFLAGSSATLLVQATAYAALNKLIETQGNKVVTFNATDEYFEFMYPATYPDLSIIKDGNGFNVTSAFIFTTENIDMSNGVVSMKRYRTIVTDILNQDYTFTF